MTREEAIKYFRNAKGLSSTFDKAADMAIDALLAENSNAKTQKSNGETIKWLESLKAEIGKSEHRTLWHYAEAIDMAIEALSAKPQTDYIGRADAICEVLVNDGIDNIVDRINALPSAEPNCGSCKHYEPKYDVCHAPELVKQVTSKLNNPCDSLLTDDSAERKEQKSKLEHDREWIIGCIKHDGFIKTDRFDKANQIILEALSAEAVMRDATAEERAGVQRYIDSISTEAVQVVRCKDCRHRCKEPIYSKADVHWVIYQIGDCPIICKTVGDDDFCSFGELAEQTERREE